MYSLPSEPGSIGHTLDAGFKLYVVSFKQVLVLGILAAISLTVPLHVLILAAATLPETDATPGVAMIVTSAVGFMAQAASTPTRNTEAKLTSFIGDFPVSVTWGPYPRESFASRQSLPRQLRRQA